MARTIAVANQKGGVGKTTTVVNLGVALAGLKKKTLCVDMDPQGALSVGLGIDAYSLNDTVYSALLDPAFPVRRLVYPAGAPQAEVLPGHKLVRVAFGGTQTTDKPLVASLAIECGALVSIMAADTRIVNGQTLGSMLLALPDDDKAAAALEYIRNYPGITFEEVNG